MLEGEKVVSTLFLSLSAAEEEIEQHGLKHFGVLFILFDVSGRFSLRKKIIKHVFGFFPKA